MQPKKASARAEKGVFMSEVAFGIYGLALGTFGLVREYLRNRPPIHSVGREAEDVLKVKPLEKEPKAQSKKKAK
jgi:hypothetical protein